MTDYSPEPTFRFYIDQYRSASYMRSELSAGWYGVTIALPADEAIEAWNLVCRMPLLKDPESPDDILPYIAKDRKLSRYYTETASQHRDRLWNAWELYSIGGTEEAVESQLTAAGFGPEIVIGEYGNPDVDYGDDQYVYGDRGVYVEYRPDAKGPRGELPPYRTQFWVVFNEGFHPVTGYAVPWGDFVWGDISEGVWGYQGFSRQFKQLVVGIVKKWKASDYVFRGFTFIVNNIHYGDEDIDYGDTDVIYGGSVNVPIDFYG